ncbi:IS21-like element helper ATPase IstB [Paraglaciecola sp. MB-3u-78]|uniref:IS21-like element helper ATPase IstB n=1 Tax=Paraglaciecola sp. MB-3u-78 TaxID=2058332 RepID=UPI000C326743|nr:IS21-like element helper ATPase IstB [Paraglaciecola sp. MB-3u-78]PKG93306.1 ATP-binding protein [Paraglaciecola sp. MB-3u-78]PKG98620.1 ATP-binding protein [Paraglaciecola sp. MB-3u-78]
MQSVTQQINTQLATLKLSGIRDALSQQSEQPNLYVEQSFEERLCLLLDHEITQRDQRKIDRLTRQAKFRVNGILAQLDYGASRQLNKTQIRSLAQGEWLRLHQNILITGATGCGKTYLACALGHNHCQQGENVYYFRLKELLEKMFMAQADGSYRKLINKLTSANLLILDDWGLEPLTPQQRSDLLELIDARYDTKSTLIASQLPIENWYDMIGESTHADAILDRLVHGAIKLELKGESMRKKLNSLTEADHTS